MTPTKNHMGRKIGRIREIKGMKQEELAQKMGTNQQAISAMENNETISDEKLAQVAEALDISPEAIENFSEERVNNLFFTFKDNSSNNGHNGFNSIFHFNPIDKIVELYERLLEAEKRTKN
ncbi:helix-turn-helix domain-containing protein [Pedobacter sp. ASV28]|uniref:helix-turn-helix domain-containing protein n=1 Tax=Pedobacter sp. ASV28 TaxID=2795123 RepID=UPI0018EDE254|nr:helix-turn-helix transcriptional regulator [Pedobacter sp. ASV28]